MSKKTTLKDALDAWEEWKAMAGDGGAIPPAELYEFLLHPENYAERGELLHKLAHDPTALQALGVMRQSMEEAADRMADWDLALPRAAATKLEGSKTITSEGGKYTVEFRPHLSQPNRGMITLQVTPQHREHLEGKIATVQDRSSRILLQARIINGEASQEVADLNQINYGLSIKIDSGE